MRSRLVSHEFRNRDPHIRSRKTAIGALTTDRDFRTVASAAANTRDAFRRQLLNPGHGKTPQWYIRENAVAAGGI